MKTIEKILLPWRCVVALAFLLFFFSVCVAASGFALMAFKPSMIPDIWDRVFGDTWSQIREGDL